MVVEKAILRPITTKAKGARNQSEFTEIACNLLKPLGKSRVQGAIGFGFASHWLKNWGEIFKPITKRNIGNHVISFDRHFKTALFNGKSRNANSAPSTKLGKSFWSEVTILPCFYFFET